MNNETPDGFNLELNFFGSWTQSQLDMGAMQAELLSNYIIGDLFDYGSIDDVRIEITSQYIDGTDGVLGRGGATQVRSDGTVTTGIVQLDLDDLADVESSGLLDELFMHEMLHAIGFGTTWHYLGLTSGNTFIGENAMDVYGSAVPIDGTWHLSEAVGNEMGTTYIDNNTKAFTDLTLAILEDMGYQTIYDASAYV